MTNKSYDPIVPRGLCRPVLQNGLTDSEQQEAELRSRDAAKPVPQPPVEPTEFEKSVADALLGIEHALQELYLRFAGRLDQPEAVRLESGIRTCRAANAKVRAMLGAELRGHTTKFEISHLRWPAKPQS
jgi:hypothetical protein